MSRIIFNKKAATKTSNLMLRLEGDLYADVQQIAEKEDVSMTEVSRAFLRAGVEKYHEEGADVETE